MEYYYSLLFFGAIAVVNLQIVFACITLPCGFLTGCFPAPPAPCIFGCVSGYRCGGFGCFRVKKHRLYSPKMLNGSGVKFDLGNMDINMANVHFLHCCEDRQLPDPCLEKCNYAKYTQKTALSILHGVDQCPIAATLEIHKCAGQNLDHSECCLTKNMPDNCLQFCNATRIAYNFTAEQLKCPEQFDRIVSCFKQNIFTNEKPSGNEEEPIMMDLDFDDYWL